MHSGRTTDGTQDTPLGTNKWGGTYRVRYGHLEPAELPSVEWFGTQKANLVKGTLNHTNEKKYKFFSRLIDSVRAEGFRNPVSWSVPAALSGNSGKPFNYGGSRTLVAKFLGVPLPVIVCDHYHDPRFDDWRPIECLDDVLACFRDPPSYIEFTADLFQFWGCDMTHLEPGSAGWRFFNLMQPKQDRSYTSEYVRGIRKDKRAAWYSRYAGKRFEDGKLTEFEPSPMSTQQQLQEAGNDLAI